MDSDNTLSELQVQGMLKCHRRCGSECPDKVGLLEIRRERGWTFPIPVVEPVGDR